MLRISGKIVHRWFNKLGDITSIIIIKIARFFLLIPVMKRTYRLFKINDTCFEFSRDAITYDNYKYED